MTLRILLAAFLAMTLPVTASASAPEPIEGRWRKGNMEIEIRPCGSAWCGTVTDASDSQRAKARKGSGVELLGLKMISGLTRDDRKGHYKGRVFIADRNLSVKGTITMVANNRIKVRGCAALGMICREREWVRTAR